MKLLFTSLFLLLAAVAPVFAQTASPSGQVKGIYDDPFAGEYSDESTASASVSATPRPTPRAVTYMSTADTPVSGAIENTLLLLAGGAVFITLGFKVSKE